MIDLDFSGDRESSKELIEALSTPVDEGTYELLIIDAEIKPNKDSQKHPSLKITFDVVEIDKKKIFKWIYLDMSNEIQKAVLREFLEAVYNEELSGHISLDPKDLIGRRVIAEVLVVPRNDVPDKMTNDIDYFMPFS